MCLNYVSPQGLYVIHRFGAFLLLYMSDDEGYFVTNDVQCRKGPMDRTLFR
jgi:hypothetical protein